MSERTAVYQLLDEAGAPLYVGMSSNFPKRLLAHSQSKPWYDRVRSIVLTYLPTRTDAAQEETRLIQSLRPPFNTRGFALLKRSIVLSGDEFAAISDIARTERRSFNSVVRQAIAEFLARRKAKQEAA